MISGLDENKSNKIIEALKSIPEIKRAILFGSRAKGTFKNSSDIDIAVVGEQLLNSKIVNRLLDKLEQINLPHQFDILNYHQIDSKELLDHIDRVGIDLI